MKESRKIELQYYFEMPKKIISNHPFIMQCDFTKFIQIKHRHPFKIQLQQLCHYFPAVTGGSSKMGDLVNQKCHAITQRPNVNFLKTTQKKSKNKTTNHHKHKKNDR